MAFVLNARKIELLQLNLKYIRRIVTRAMNQNLNLKTVTEMCYTFLSLNLIRGIPWTKFNFLQYEFEKATM